MTRKLEDVVCGLESLTGLPDPVGHTQLSTRLDDGLDLYRVSCPIGVIGVIFESRPDALVQISGLCLKSGNAVLLKGGSEALETNRALAEIIAAASLAAGLPDGWIGLLETRDDVNQLLKMDQDVDLLIPRGSNEFVRYIMDQHTDPGAGACRRGLPSLYRRRLRPGHGHPAGSRQQNPVCGGLQCHRNHPAARSLADSLLQPPGRCLAGRSCRDLRLRPDLRPPGLPAGR